MKKTAEYIVLRSKKKGHYLVGYENKPTAFACASNWSADIQDAVNVPLDVWEKAGGRHLGLCQLFDAEPIKVKAEYTLETLDGEPAVEIERNTKAEFLQFLEDALEGGIK